VHGAGVDPRKCVPMFVDVGTNRQALLDDPQYHGLRQKRVTGEAYDAFMQEFVEAVQQWQPHTVLQFEDFGNQNAFRCASCNLPCAFGTRNHTHAAVSKSGAAADLILQKSSSCWHLH
jgi:malate dehydrogenase (oxaloacetate-decarboxylating)(NADP+)